MPSAPGHASRRLSRSREHHPCCRRQYGLRCQDPVGAESTACVGRPSRDCITPPPSALPRAGTAAAERNESVERIPDCDAIGNGGRRGGRGSSRSAPPFFHGGDPVPARTPRLLINCSILASRCWPSPGGCKTIRICLALDMCALSQQDLTILTIRLFQGRGLVVQPSEPEKTDESSDARIRQGAAAPRLPRRTARSDCDYQSFSASPQNDQRDPPPSPCF